MRPIGFSIGLAYKTIPASKQVINICWDMWCDAIELKYTGDIIIDLVNINPWDLDGFGHV